MKYIYPQKTHNQKKNYKLTISDIIEIRKEYLINPNKKILADKYNVAPSTIRRWVDESFRKKASIDSSKRSSKEWKNNIEYRKHHLYRKSKNLKQRVSEDIVFADWYRNHSRDMNGILAKIKIIMDEDTNFNLENWNYIKKLVTFGNNKDNEMLL